MTEDRDMYALISGYLDGELSLQDRAHVEQLMDENEAFRKEFEEMKKLVSAVSRLDVEHPPEEVWDTFLQGVYNRMERRVGWVLVIVGAAILAVLGVYWFIVDPWGSALLKLLVACPIVGLIVLFVSVLRERLLAAKTDRYSKEVER